MYTASGTGDDGVSQICIHPYAEQDGGICRHDVVAADADMEDLVKKAMNQNFVPVVDDQNKFIGIITRRSIIEYCYDKLNDCDK